MPYLRLIGTISSRTSLVTAWSETARLTPISAPARAIIGTTPEVERVMRRFDKASPSPSITSFSASRTCIEIIERLAHAHHHDVGEHAALGLARPFAQAHRAPACTWPTISPAVRLRTRRIVPVWQKRQLSVQPTWLDTHKRPAIGIGDEHHLVILPVGRAQQPFARAVGRDLRLDHVGPADHEALGEPGMLRLGDVGHRGELGRAAIVHPVPELLGAQLGLFRLHARLFQRSADRLPGQADQVDLAVLAQGRRAGTGTGSMCPGMGME